MNHVETPVRISQLIKAASPKWLRVVEQLSRGNQHRLANVIPAGKVRLTSKNPLGVGAEGAVFPSFTGGVGPTATKTFFKSPLSSEFTSPNVLGPGKVTSMLSDVDIPTRVNIMKSNPDIFPKVFAQHPTGYTVERLQEGIASSALRARMRSLVQASKNLQKLETTPYRTEQRGYLNDEIRNLWRTGRPEAKSVEPLRSLLNSKKNTRGELVAKTDTDRYKIRDFNLDTRRPHNVMWTAEGRPVISDPMPFKFQPIEKLRGEHKATTEGRNPIDYLRRLLANL